MRRMKQKPLFGTAHSKIEDHNDENQVKRPGKTLSLMKPKRKYNNLKRTIIPRRVKNAMKRSGRVGTQHTRVFKCHLESCGKIFSDRASLKKHMTVHGDKLVSPGYF